MALEGSDLRKEGGGGKRKWSWGMDGRQRKDGERSEGWMKVN